MKKIIFCLLVSFSSQAQTYLPESINYFSRCDTASGVATYSDSEKVVINAFIGNLINASLWNKVGFLWVSAAPKLNSAMVPIKSTSGNMTYDAYSESNYNPLMGLLGRVGTTGYINTHYIFASPLTTNSLSIMINKILLSSGVNTTMNCNQGSTKVFSLTIGTTGIISISNLNSTTGGASSALGIRTPGYISSNRNSAALNLYNEKTLLLNKSSTTGSLPTIPFVFYGNNSGTPAKTGDNSNAIDMLCFSSGLTFAQDTTFRNILNQFRKDQKRIYYSNYTPTGQQYNVVMLAGQSLDNGYVNGSAAALSAVQTRGHLRLNAGSRPGTSTSGAFTPLTEALTSGSGSYAGSETPLSSFANRIYLADSTHKIIATSHAKGGTAYSGLNRGTQQFGYMLQHIAEIIKLSKDAGYAIPKFQAILFNHGQADQDNGTINYSADIVEYQKDCQYIIEKATGKPFTPLIITQLSEWDVNPPVIALEQYKAVKSAYSIYLSDTTILPSIVCAGPLYTIPAIATNSFHKTTNGYRQIGEQIYAKAYNKMILQNMAWTGLRPDVATGLSNVDSVITIPFYVPVAPLSLDTTFIADPGQKGFEATVNGISRTIIKVSLNGATMIDLVLSGTINTGDAITIRYAYTNPNTGAGVKIGARGNLRDSDIWNSEFGYNTHNWCMTFEETFTAQ